MVKRDSNFNPLGKSRGVRRQGASTADWASVGADAIRRAITAAAVCGGALRFGYSRDGGAYAVGIYGDGDPYTEFVRPSDDIEGFLEDVIALFDDLGDDNAAAPAAQNSTATGPKKPSK